MYNLSYLQNEYGGLFNVLVALLVRYTSELKNNNKKIIVDGWFKNSGNTCKWIIFTVNNLHVLKVLPQFWVST